MLQKLHYCEVWINVPFFNYNKSGFSIKNIPTGKSLSKGYIWRVTEVKQSFFIVLIRDLLTQNRISLKGLLFDFFRRDSFHNGNGGCWFLIRNNIELFYHGSRSKVIILWGYSDQNFKVSTFQNFRSNTLDRYVL